jgi:hypothetical protein
MFASTFSSPNARQRDHSEQRLLRRRRAGSERIYFQFQQSAIATVVRSRQGNTLPAAALPYGVDVR